MTIRKTTIADLQAVLNIYYDAREFMRETGNPNQWKNTHPPQAMIEGDIDAEKSYVCVCDDAIVAVFYFNIEIDPMYVKIDGRWLNDEPYGVVHRIARAQNAKGAGAFCLEWCFQQCGNLRIDTHEDNVPMKKLLDRLGYLYCGIVWMPNGDERLAYQKCMP